MWSTTYVPMLRLLWQIERLRRRVVRELGTTRYTDLALEQQDCVGVEDLDLYRTSDAARSAADWARRRDAARAVTAAAR